MNILVNLLNIIKFIFNGSQLRNDDTSCTILKFF